MINITVIESLRPCEDRLDNYRKFYGEKMFTRRQFMGLKNITQSDKEWVVFRLLPKDKIGLAAADIAESVLHLFEAKYPNDDRPRKAIVAARSTTMTAAEKRNAAAYAYAAAYAAADAAADAAYAAAYAADATAYADAAAYNARRSVFASSDKSRQGKFIRTVLLKYWSQSAKEAK